jgi:HipA-like C-terminal domain
MRETDGTLEQILKCLAFGPLSSAALQARLGISQATLSRTIQKNASQFVTLRLHGVRTPQYGQLRSLTGVKAIQAMYRIDEAGRVHPFAELMFLRGGATVVSQRGVESGSRGKGGGLHQVLFAGLPPAMAFAAPSGFLGRALAAESARTLAVPASLAVWSDDHRIIHLCAASPDTPGNFIFGDASLSLWMERHETAPAPAPTPAPIAVNLKPTSYVEIAMRLTQSGASSSAGGEQPKFLCETEDQGHVLVKFAKAGSRASDLLALENLALRALNATGLNAAPSQYFENAGIAFLEVQRFDRVGRRGRRGVVSAGAYDDEVFGRRDSWAEFADRCESARILPPPAAQNIRTLAAFGQLIGNTDMHFENLSLMLGDDGAPTDVSPAYDMLPMQYASLGAGMDPPLKVVMPKVGAIGARPAVWKNAFDAALLFWQRAATDATVSKPMRAAAKLNAAAISAFVAPLLPAAELASAEKLRR